MTSNHEQIYKKWIETRLSAEPEKDLINQVMARIENIEKKRPDALGISKIIFEHVLENNFVRISIAFGLTFLGFFRLACVSRLFIP